MPQIRVKVDGKLDGQVDLQEKAIKWVVVKQVLKTDVAQKLTEDEKKEAEKFAQTLLGEYLTELHKGYDEACKDSGNSCRLDTTKVIDIETATAEQVLSAYEGKISDNMLTFGALVIGVFQHESHKLNAARLAKERRGEKPYSGMYS